MFIFFVQHFIKWNNQCWYQLYRENKTETESHQIFNSFILSKIWSHICMYLEKERRRERERERERKKTRNKGMLKSRKIRFVGRCRSGTNWLVRIENILKNGRPILHCNDIFRGSKAWFVYNHNKKILIFFFNNDSIVWICNSIETYALIY